MVPAVCLLVPTFWSGSQAPSAAVISRAPLHCHLQSHVLLVMVGAGPWVTVTPCDTWSSLYMRQNGESFRVVVGHDDGQVGRPPSHLSLSFCSTGLSTRCSGQPDWGLAGPHVHPAGAGLAPRRQAWWVLVDEGVSSRSVRPGGQTGRPGSQTPWIRILALPLRDAKPVPPSLPLPLSLVV